MSNRCILSFINHSSIGVPLPSSDFLRKVEMTAALVMGWAKVLSYSQAVGPDEGNHRILFGKVPEVNQAMINDPRNIQQDRRNGPRKQPEYLIALYIATYLIRGPLVRSHLIFD